MAIFLIYSYCGITAGKRVCREFKMTAILKILKYLAQLQFDLRYEKIVPNYTKKDFFSWWWRHRWRHRGPQSFPLYSCLGEVGSGIKLQGQCLVNKCKYRNCLSMLCMPKGDLNGYHFSRLQVKGQGHRLTRWPWHLNGRNSVNFGIIKIKQKLKYKKYL